MKIKHRDINIEQFQSINDVFQFIEDNVFDLRRNYDLVNLWVKYRDYTKDEDEKKKSQWEIDCFMFEIKGERLFSQIYSIKKDESEINKYPDLSKFQIDVIEYLKERIKSSNNSILLARYNHLLWKCPKGIKRLMYALNAIDNYILSISKYYELDDIYGNQDNSFQIGELFEILVLLSSEVKSDKTKLKELTIFLLFKAKRLKFYTLHSILEDMLSCKKIFKPKDFENTLSLFQTQLEESKGGKEDFLLVNEYLPSAIKIAAKIKSDTKNWQNEIGLAFLRMAEEITQEEKFWIKQDYHAKAIEAFKLSGNLEYRKKAEILYANLKPQIKLPTHTISYTEEIQDLLKKHQENIKIKARNILKKSSHDIYRFVSSGTFFPDYNDVIKASEKKGNTFLDFATTISFDKNKNITNQKANNKELRKVFESYQFHLEISALPYLHYILIFGIKSGKLTFENLIGFLVEKTWIGKLHIQYDLGGDEKLVNLVQQISPAIIEFYLQIQAWQSTKYYKPSFILCIDSLTLKMEGIFRSFCERVGVPTSLNREKGMQEAYIHNVFDNEIIIEFFNEDDRLLFNYLFSSDGGLNLRNNVAHCFYHVSEYHSDKMLLLIAVLLRVGKYDIKKQNSK
ncbi:DUF4209 domain-containing protein [Kordia jejudonensis]|uniref:DUF4209 domain-containing protein n=1 Tax=Kordia jejudonensis TaxID=1348245 RepID=UPI0006299227|nr:DUF4209 domain-containing protein [Kordia jejudonensis]